MSSEEILTKVLEYNAKIFVFIVLFMYFSFSLYISYKIVPRLSDFTTVTMAELLVAGWLRIISIIFLFFYPLYTIVFLFSGVALELIMRYIFVAYGIFGILIGVFGLIFGFEKFLELFGLNLFKKENKVKRYRAKIKRK